MKQSDLRDMIKRPSRLTVHELLWLSPHNSVSYSINFFNYDDSRKCREDLDDPEPADEGDIQIEYSSDWLYSQSTGQ